MPPRKKLRKTVDIDIVVPIVPKDHKYLSRLLREFENSRRIPTNVILAASSQTEESLQQINKAISSLKLTFQVIIESTSGTRLAGENRNVGASRATSTYIAYCDADDSYSWNRLYRAAQVIDKEDPDLLIHSYSVLSPRFWLLFKLVKRDIAGTKDILEATFPDGTRDTELEIAGKSGMTNLKLPPRFGDNYRIVHGHTIAKRSTPIKFTSKSRCEDGVFCRDFVFLGYKVIYLNEKLSNYNRPTIRKVIRAYFPLIVRLKKKISSR
jgi:glycosyltransferase involved in cell wall biosynthesis